MSGLSLDPRKTALVVIDLQNALMGFTSAPYPVADVVKRSRQIADALRAKGGLVVWVRVDINRILRLPVDQPTPFAGQQVPAELMEIVPSAGFQDGDMLITKHHWGAFAGTALQQSLTFRGIDTVLLTGVSSNAGVESTLREGTGLGFAFVAVEDACSAFDGDEHRYSFEKIFPKLARVRTSEEVLNAMA
jgi:nicotinamidase-related amidase